MVNDFEVIHMGGRTYNPILGRFMQADPFVQAPANLQNYNRYSYVLNNPMSYTDPSGYFFKKLKKYWRVVASVALTIAAPWGTGLWATIATGALSGYIATGSLRGAMIGAFSAGLFHGIGSAMPGGSFGSGAHLGKTLAHGVAGGISSVLSGGKFGHGFASAGFAQLGAPAIDKIGGRIGNTVSGSYFDTANRALRIVSAAVVGGTSSTLAGGKFANGAITAAFSRGFNDERHHKQQEKFKITETERELVAAGKLQEFWESRLKIGDPVAKAGLASLNPESGLYDYLFGGTSINNRLQAFANVYNGGVLDIEQIRVDLAHAHIRAVDTDVSGVIGLLNPKQIADYHHVVFAAHGLPPTAFGGTPFTGNSGGLYPHRLIWCRGCDWK